MINHYDWLNENFVNFVFLLDNSVYTNNDIIVAHGDKCYGYKSLWEEQGIPFHHGVAIYLLSYLKPWRDQVRETEDGWVAPIDWVCEKYMAFKPFLEKVEELKNDN